MDARKLPQSPNCADSFAYKTMKDRLPVIITRATDYVHRQHAAIRRKYGEAGDRDLKLIIRALSKLRYEVMTNKPIAPLSDQERDVAEWNRCLEEVRAANGGEPVTWFSGPRLFLECYVYRRVQEGIKHRPILNFVDVFREQKKEAYWSSDFAVYSLMTFLVQATHEQSAETSGAVCTLFKQLMQAALWGNKSAAAISANHGNHTDTPLEKLHVLSHHILVDDSDAVLNALIQAKSRRGYPSRVDMVLHRAGFELVADLCLAEFLLSVGLASRVHFHGKAMPWFVLDVTKHDFEWTVEHMAASHNSAISNFGHKWREHLQDGSWVFKAEDFWTLPHDYSRMQTTAPELYQGLGESDLLLFKGDLNYRKLVGDIKWDPSKPFQECLRGFHPAPLCVLRVLESDVVCGLTKSQTAEIAGRDAGWMTDGNWAVIQFSEQKET